MRRDKWNKINFLIDKLHNRTFELGELGDLRRVSYAPNIGYRSWIFLYKGYFVALFDAGNDHYDFHMPVNWIDVIVAKIITSKFASKVCDVLYEIRKKVMKVEKMGG